jgi:pyruvate,water dikinase
LALAGEPAADDRIGERRRAWATISRFLARDGHATRASRAVRVTVLRALVRQTRYRLAWRERMRYCRTHVFAIGRRLSRALDRRLMQLGLTERSGDVHYLDIAEIRGCLRGTLSATDLAELARQRRACFTAFAAGPPPPHRFETVGPPGATSIRTLPAAQSPTPVEDLHGTGVWGGIVRARCRVIRDPQVDAAEPGEIIVAQSTDPGWVPLMLGAAGLLVENGSLLSHSAIVARELGLPTIVGIRDLTARLSSGELIEMDGARGTVRRARDPA